MYVFFDTETNGLPLKFGAPATDLGNWPRIIQLAFVVTDKDFNVIYRFCHLISPDGWTIPQEKFWIDNGYSTERNAAEGIPMDQGLLALADVINMSTHVFAHNMAFDYPIIAAEMIRYGVRCGNKPKRICTMKSTTDVCQIPGKRGYKWPKLEELHQFLFNEGFDNAHDALADVEATVRCARELYDRGQLDL